MTEKFIYFLRPVGHVGPIKIGCSKFPEGRLEALAIQSPLRLELVAAVPGTHADERRLHGMFAKHWLHHEWFGASKELLALLDYVTANDALPALPEGEIVRLPRKQAGRANGGSRPPSQKVVAFGALIRADYEAGQTCGEIAARLGRNIATVTRALRAVGVQVRRGKPPREKHVEDVARAEEFKRRYVAGETLDAIGQDYGISRERVRQVLRKYEVPSLGWRAEHLRRSTAEAQSETVILLAEEGKTVEEIAAAVGDQRQNIRTCLRRRGIKAARAKKPFLPKTLAAAAKAAELYRAGVKTREIAAKLGIQQPDIYRLLHIQGVKPCRQLVA